MIIGDKIVTTHLTLDGRPVTVPVVAIEHGQIVWDFGWDGGRSTLGGRWYFEHAHVLAYMSTNSTELILYNARGESRSAIVASRGVRRGSSTRSSC